MKTASFEKREWIDPWRDRYPMTDDMVLVTFCYDGKLRVDTAWILWNVWNNKDKAKKTVRKGKKYEDDLQGKKYENDLRGSAEAVG